MSWARALLSSIPKESKQSTREIAAASRAHSRFVYSQARQLRKLYPEAMIPADRDQRSWLQVFSLFASARTSMNELINGWKQCSSRASSKKCAPPGQLVQPHRK